ncbi:hypothetical protein KY289_008977 [Solanum tuberosum]|nr:hypothetical protein KY289_008977 [Solanum tuberosum]
MDVFPNSRNVETTQATPPIENPIELLVNEAFGGLRHEGVDVGPSPVMEEEETLHDTPALNKKNLFELLKDGSQELYEGSKQLCMKILTISNLEKLQNRIVETLSHLEILFPPSFFTVMIDLTVHLVDEVKQGGPVHYRWMYFVERLLGHFKSLVRNKSQSEGSIAEGHKVEEVLSIYSRYFDEIESRLNRPKRVNDEPNHNEASGKSSIFPQQGKPIGGSTTEPLTTLEKTQAHRYVLLNCAAVKPFIDEFRQHIKRSTRGRRVSTTEVEKRVSKEFPDWFPKRIMNPDIAETISDDMKEQGSKTQNSGVFLISDTSCIASSVDRFKVILFKCLSADTTRNRGYKTNAWKFNCVNFSKLIHTGDREDHDPYIKSSQANMIYYVDDKTDKEWSVVVHLKPRDLFEMGEVDEEDLYENEPYQQQEFGQFFYDDYENIQIAIDENMNE